MFSLKKSSAFVVALAAISFYPLAACAEAEKDPNTVIEKVGKTDGKELKNLKIKVRGDKGTKTYEGDYDNVDVNVSGSSDVVVKGTAKSVDLNVSGSADVDLEELEADTVDLNLSGSADVYVRANESFEINASGSGRLYLYGKGKIKSQKYTGSMKVYDKRKK